MKCLLFNEKTCTSCTYLNLSYEDSLKIKEQDFFKHFPIEEANYLGIVPVKEATFSRNKAKLAVALIGKEISFGIYSRDQVFTSLETCPLHMNGINDILPLLKKYLDEYKIVPYDLISKKGELKNILITKSDTTNELMIRFVLRSKESLDRMRLLAKKLQMELSDIQLISANIQPLHSAILEGDIECILTERETIIHRYEDIKLHLGVKSFFQVTSEIARALYGEVASFLEAKKAKSLLDLYCGVGAFSFYASKFVDQVYGVEISKEAIDFAQLTKKENQIANVDFKALDVAEFWDKLDKRFEVILVNPPRKGVGEFSMRKILELAPDYLIYSSCNVETLDTDFAHIQNDYKIISSKIFDMFPFSKHFEVLMIFEKIK